MDNSTDLLLKNLERIRDSERFAQSDLRWERVIVLEAIQKIKSDMETFKFVNANVAKFPNAVVSYVDGYIKR